MDFKKSVFNLAQRVRTSRGATETNLHTKPNIVEQEAHDHLMQRINGGNYSLSDKIFGDCMSEDEAIEFEHLLIRHGRLTEEKKKWITDFERVWRKFWYERGGKDWHLKRIGYDRDHDRLSRHDQVV